MYSLAIEGNATDGRIPAFLEGQMLLCDEIPSSNWRDVCTIIWGDQLKLNGDSNVQSQGVNSSLPVRTCTIPRRELQY